MPAKHMTQTYEEFARDPAPLRLARELAEQRTLAQELRDSIDNTRHIDCENFIEEMGKQIATFIQYQMVPPVIEKLTEVLRADGTDDATIDLLNDIVKNLALGWMENNREEITNMVRRNWMLTFGAPARHITVGEATALSKIYETTSKIAGQMQKLETGLTIQVDYGNDLLEILATVVNKIMLPYVPPKLREQCADRAFNLLPMLVSGRKPIEVIDGQV